MEAGLPIDVALPIVIAIMMFAVGMSLRVENFTGLLRMPVPACVGLIVMFAVFPLLAFLVASMFPLAPELQVGLVLLAASPSASTSTLFTYLARGDVALSVALTAASKVLPVLTIPFYVNYAALAFAGSVTTLTLSFADTSERLALTVLLPTIAGMALRYRYPRVDRMRPLVTQASVLALVALIAVLVFRERNALPGMFVGAGPAAFSLCVLGMLAAQGSAALFKLPLPQRTAITIEVGMQSGGTSIAIAAGLLGSPAMAVPAAVYSLIMYVMAGAFAAARRSLDARAALTIDSRL